MRCASKRRTIARVSSVASTKSIRGSVDRALVKSFISEPNLHPVIFARCAQSELVFFLTNSARSNYVIVIDYMRSRQNTVFVITINSGLEIVP